MPLVRLEFISIIECPQPELRADLLLVVDEAPSLYPRGGLRRNMRRAGHPFVPGFGKHRLPPPRHDFTAVLDWGSGAIRLNPCGPHRLRLERVLDSRSGWVLGFEDAELVAFGVAEHDPGQVALPDVRSVRSEAQQAVDLDGLVVGEEVDAGDSWQLWGRGSSRR